MYFTATFLCSIVFSVYATLSPYMAVLVRSLGFSANNTGILLGAAELVAIGAPFIFGTWADRRGDYKTPLLFVLAITLVSALAVFLLKTPAAAVICIPLLSLGYRALVPLSDAAITVNIGREGNYGKIRAMGSLSFVVMVLFLQFTPFRRPSGAENIMFWTMAMSIVSVLFVLFAPVSFLRPFEKRPFEKRTSGTQDELGGGGGAIAPPLSAIEKNQSIWTPAFILGVAIIFFNRLSFSPIQSYISLYAVEYLHWDAVGLLAGISASAELPLIFMSSKLLKRFSPAKLLAVTSGAIALRLSLIALFPYSGVLVATQLLHSLTFGVFHPAAIAFITMHVPPRQRAAGMSVYMSLGTGLPTLAGNVSGGMIIGRFGYRALFGSFVIFALLSVLLYVIMGKRMIPQRGTRR
jgi:PPP family 3-phenylpropionic acid transporter